MLCFSVVQNQIQITAVQDVIKNIVVHNVIVIQTISNAVSHFIKNGLCNLFNLNHQGIK